MSISPLLQRDNKSDAEASDHPFRSNSITTVIASPAQIGEVFDATIAALLGSSETGTRLNCVRWPFETDIPL